MKYIRTKDGQVLKVLEIVQNKYIKEGYYYKVDTFQKRDVGVYPKDVIKQANTIEELCDEFVTIGLSKPAHYFQLSRAKKVKNTFGSEIKEIYGAIWTDKGLIYVAKMNDKGELELL